MKLIKCEKVGTGGQATHYAVGVCPPEFGVAESPNAAVRRSIPTGKRFVAKWTVTVQRDGLPADGR
jgi:hypothetical protein